MKGGSDDMKFGVWGKQVENYILISAALHGANIFQIFFTC